MINMALWLGDGAFVDEAFSDRVFSDVACCLLNCLSSSLFDLGCTGMLK